MKNTTEARVVTPWHNQQQIENFLRAWGGQDPRMVLEWDEHGEGCAVTKNRGIERALQDAPDVIIVLDDDCFPHDGMTFDRLIEAHLEALTPQRVEIAGVITDPPSRGTPYHRRSALMPVACSMGYWNGVGDYDACGQLVHGATRPMRFSHEPVHGRYVPLSGMNIAFPARLWPLFRFVDVPRFDDIWMGWIFQRVAYARGMCVNLGGPTVWHSRQSNVWANLRDESRWLEENDTLWAKIAAHPSANYDELVKLLPL
jgi:glycosyltransferase involved in cell wall biosynthesis